MLVLGYVMLGEFHFTKTAPRGKNSTQRARNYVYKKLKKNICERFGFGGKKKVWGKVPKHCSSLIMSVPAALPEAVCSFPCTGLMLLFPRSSFQLFLN